MCLIALEDFFVIHRKKIIKKTTINLITGTSPESDCLQFRFVSLRQGKETPPVPHQRLKVISLRDVVLTWLGTPVYVLIINALAN